MTVFKNYIKISKKYIGFVIMYLAIFSVIAVIASNSVANTSIDSFQDTKSKVSIIDNDNTNFTNDFSKYIESKSEIVAIENDQQAIRDALVYKKVDFVLIIPKDFTNKFFEGKDIKIETMSVPDSTSAVYTKSIMNDYLNIASTYINTGIKDESLLSKNILETLNINTEVKIINEEKTSVTTNIVFYYNILSYILVMSIMSVVAMMMVTFNDDRINKRHLVSSVSYKSIDKQILLGNALISFAILFVYTLISFILYPKDMLSTSGLLLIINACIFTLFALCLAYLSSKLVKNKEAINGIANVVGLGGSFISGVFVPQQFLGASVLTIAKFTPIYWYVSANLKIGSLTSYSFEELKPIFIDMSIVFVFAFILFICTKIVAKSKLEK